MLTLRGLRRLAAFGLAAGLVWHRREFLRPLFLSRAECQSSSSSSQYGQYDIFDQVVPTDIAIRTLASISAPDRASRGMNVMVIDKSNFERLIAILQDIGKQHPLQIVKIDCQAVLNSDSLDRSIREIAAQMILEDVVRIKNQIGDSKFIDLTLSTAGATITRFLNSPEIIEDENGLKRWNIKLNSLGKDDVLAYVYIPTVENYEKNNQRINSIMGTKNFEEIERNFKNLFYESTTPKLSTVIIRDPSVAKKLGISDQSSHILLMR